MEPQNTFLVRFRWRSRGGRDPAAAGWYGHIQHLQTGEAISFVDAAQLLAFIRRYVTSFETQRPENAQGNDGQPSGTLPPVERV